MSIRSAARWLRTFLFGNGPVRVPAGLSRNHSEPSDRAALKEALTRKYADYLAPGEQAQPASEDARDNLHSYIDIHAELRLERARSEVIPWLADFASLRGKRILEVGCGTGSSTVALAEQGAKVTSTDEDDASLDVTRSRLALHGLSAEVLKVSGVALGTFDIVIMHAVLEHMTLAERLSALRSAWGALSTGGLLLIGETPNRLWYQDIHTSSEPFFMWLPDDLAMLYSEKTSRPGFNEGFTDLVTFARWGRGVSYHDVEVALGLSASDLPVVSALKPWMRKQRFASQLYRQARVTPYERFLRQVGPPVHSGFYSEWLDIILRKP